MIPNANEAATVQSTMKGERGQFTVDENSLTHIMSVLTNLYSDPEQAVVREYLTNAFDSHVDAGTTRPVEVTTPSHFNKAYVIKDYGLGMSVDDLKNTYSKYGASTKRNSNSVVGMLGLGSKSALTYTNMFTITAIKNGVQAKAIISVNEDGVPEFQIADTKATDEPNSVEIRIPVKDRNSFAEKTREFLKYWADGLVLVDGKEPEKHGLTKIKDHTLHFNGADHKVEVFLAENVGGWGSSYSHSKVIMGNVAYDVDSEYVDSDLSGVGMGFIAYVPIGSLAVVPSREGLHYTSQTKAVLKEVSSGLMEHIVAAKRKEFENSANRKAAWLAWTGMSRHFRNHRGMAGAKFDNLVYKEYVQNLPHVSLSWGYDDRSNTSEGSYVYIRTMFQRDDNPLIVTGVETDKKINGFFRKKVRYYAEQNGYSTDFALLVNTDPNEEWFADVPRIDADTIKAIKLPRTPSNNGPRVEAPYDWYKFDGTSLTVGDDVNVAGKKIAYISPADMRETYRKSGTTPETLVKAINDPDLVLVVTGTNRFEKFVRTHAHAKPVRDVVQERVNELAKSASDAEFTSKSLNYGEERFFNKVKPALLDDPELAELARVVQSSSTDNYAKAETLRDTARRANIYVDVPARKSVANPARKYPLINHVGSECISDTILYVNAKFNK